jgi:hypothetical protein
MVYLPDAIEDRCAWFARPVIFVLSHTPGLLKDSTLPFHPGAESREATVPNAAQLLQSI